MFRNPILTTQYKKKNILNYRTKKSEAITGLRDWNLALSSSLPLLSIGFMFGQAFFKSSSNFTSNSYKLSYSSTKLFFPKNSLKYL